MYGITKSVGFFFKIYLLIYFWLCSVFRAVGRLSLVAASSSHSSSWYSGFSLWWRLQSMGSGVVAHGLSWLVACGLFLNQGWNPRPLHWQVDSFFFFFGRWILNHGPTREALELQTFNIYFDLCDSCPICTSIFNSLRFQFTFKSI